MTEARHISSIKTFDLPRRLFAEALGTAFLLAAVVGSGIMGDTLSNGNVALALLANSIATGAVLVVLILIFSPVSGAHFNPAVTVSFAIQKTISWEEAIAYVIAQVCGAFIGVLVAHAMFAQELIQLSSTARTGLNQSLAEFVATFGLVATILGCVRFRPDAVAYAVGLFITAGYWFTASTSFANPAVTIARMFTDTFTGISPIDAPAFVAAQIVGAITVTFVLTWLWKGSAQRVAARS